MPTRSRSGGFEVAAALRHAAAGQAARRARDTAQDRRRRHRRDHPSDPGGDAAWRHAQVLAFNGQRDGPCAADDRPHLACLRSAAAPCQDLQALHRPAVRHAPAGLAGSPAGTDGARRARWCATSWASTWRRRTHDYTRPVNSADIPRGDRAEPDGTTSLFAALDIATGAVIGRCYPKHRSSEFRSSSTRSRPACRRSPTSIWSWTITPPTRPGRSAPLGDLLTAAAPQVGSSASWRIMAGQAAMLAGPLHANGASWTNQVERFFHLADGQTDQAWRAPLHSTATERHPRLH